MDAPLPAVRAKKEWRKGFLQFVVGRWKVLLCYGPDLQWWAQWDQGDGGACAFAWFTVTWHRCVCNASTEDWVWCYCSFHQRQITNNPKLVVRRNAR